MVMFVKYLLQSQSCSLGKIFQRSLSSALYVTGDKASETYAVLTPHLDFDQRLKDDASLKRNVDLRGMELNVDELKKLWCFMKDIEATKIQLEARKVEVANKMNALKSMPSNQEVEMLGKKLRIEGKIVREDLKAMMKGLWEVEKNAVIQVLAFPNCLHADTPPTEETVIHIFGTKPDCSSESHLKKGITLNLIRYCNQLNYYLIGDAAVFELAALHFFAKEFENSKFLQFCNVDFARSVVVEGIGIKHEDPMSTLILKKEDESTTSDVNRLHLVGGASLASFAAFHAKHSTNPCSLPLKYYSMGRQYVPRPQLADDRGLFDVWQSSAVELFVCTSDDFQHMMEEFHTTLKKLISGYECLGLHFRVVYVPASALPPWESLRASVQMFSSHYQSYIEVGNLSLCDDYVSKRLLMCYQENDKMDRRFLNIVSGTAVSIPKLLGCILEQNKGSALFVPDAINKHMITNQ